MGDRFIKVFIFLALCLTIQINSQKFDWAKCLDGSGVTASDITKDNLGNNYIIGKFENTLVLGNYTLVSSGLADIFVAKIDPFGICLWAKNTGGSSNDIGKGITLDNLGNVYITGSSNGKIFIAKYSSQANLIWTKNIPSAGGDQGEKIKFLSHDKILLTGTHGGNIWFDSFYLQGTANGFRSVMDSSGRFSWAMTFGSEYSDNANGVDGNDQGLYYFSGSFGEIVALANTKDNVNTLRYRTTVGKVNSSGYLTDFYTTGIGDAFNAGVVCDSIGNFFIAGEYAETVIFDTIQIIGNGAYFAKYNQSGKIQWVKTIPGARAKSIAKDNKNNFYIVGDFSGTVTIGDSIFSSHGIWDIFAVMFDSQGVIKWANHGGGTGYDFSYGLAVGPRITIVGHSQEGAVLGELPPLTCSSAFIADIKNNYLKVTSPNGGEYLKAGTQADITWDTYTLDHVGIEYSSNGGSSWNTITVSASGGSYLWTVPQVSSNSCKIRLVYDDFLIPTQDESDSTFTIYIEGNYSLYMDGVDDYVGNIIEDRLGAGDEFTVEVWIKPESDSHCGVINRADNSTMWSYNLYTAAGTTNWGIKDGEPPSYSQSQGPSLNQWHHVAVTKDNSGKLNIFLDGVKKSSANYRPGFMSPSSQLRFGKYLDYGAGFYFKGYMTRVRISKSIRYSSSFTPTTDYLLDTNTIGQWDFGTGVGDSLFDSSISHRNGHIYGAIWSNDFPSSITSSITLNTPNGGENWAVGSVQNITWAYNGVQNVKIEYTSNNGTSWNQIVASTTSSTGSYAWRIPNATSSNCRIRITDVTNSTVSDQSDAVFTISTPTQSISVTSPNGGEYWPVGSTQNIKWVQSGVTNVKIMYSTDNGNLWYSIVASTPASSGSCLWTIPNTISTHCKVRIDDVDNSSVYDQSDSVFVISTESITVLSPNGGENWVVGSTQTISWTQTGVQYVTIDYTTNNGINWHQITASTLAYTGNYFWMIPNRVSSTCKIKITDVSNNLVTDQSNTVFSISPIQNQSVTVTSPNGGENWFSGSQYSITWNSSNVQNLKLEYSVNGGTNWSLINSSVPANLGSYIWTIPNTSSSTCKVKITSVENGTVFDESNSNFTISEVPTVILVSPNGGENWLAGSQYSITWNFVNVQKLKLEYSSNSGSDWNLIDSSVSANLGSYIWTVPNTPSTSCKVRITAVENGPVSDQSDGVFSISEPPSVQLSSPVGGEKWLSGKPYSIIWSFVNIENVKLEYSANNGLDWTTIEASFAALSGSYIWTVPAIESNQCLVRISAVNNPSVSDQSDAPFTIEPERTLSLTAPAGGEVFTSGNRMEIKWNSLNLETIDLYYSTDNGNNWHLITDSVSAALQSFYWDIPEINSNLVKIRTVYTRKSEIKSESAGTITILPSPKVVLQANISGAYLKSGTTYLLEWFVENVASVNIYFSSDEGATWNELAVNISSSVRSYNWMVPQLNSKNCRIKIASTTNPALLSVNPGNFTVYTYSASVSLTNTWQFGDIKDINNYRLVSIPGNTSENLGSIIPGKHINEWNAYWDNGEDNNYQVQYDGSDKFNFLPGKGFWVLSKNQVSLSKQTDAVMIDSTLIFRIPLHKGWNIIGNTFPKSVNWSEIRAVNSLPQNSLIYWWEGRWTFPSLMEPYKGYYYFNSDNRSQLKLIYPVEQSLTKTNRENFVALPEDRVTISFAENEITASFNGTASTGLDTNDYLLPNISFGGKSISFLQSSEAGVTRQLFVESQPKDSSGNSFRFRVVNTSTTSDLLEITPSKNIQAENVWLLDEKYSEFIDITVKDKFSIVPQDDPRYYTLLIGSPEYINSIRSKFLPVEYILYQNYPNPFNPETSIKYALPQNSHVKIKLFDILGNEVITLFEGEESAGVHTRTFDLSGFASGVYLYRLEAGDKSFVKKMVLLR